ncbi:hypothetical protein B0T25DRAFT_524024 [Lasiosphaeria hispida]|uniref:NAD(P)-binding domain-containing protein n=1 Tax=Lasiosphaeria hispida TaxID=260671 RepID=A0AAJ0HT30_9PEZI|nr:hypothetical protein B0T25DRAFT_524024 [Lasiosphaeria hispida]
MSASPNRVLVLGGTGPLGICLLRELVFRGHPTVAYCRNPSKVPEDLASNSLLEVVEGNMEDTEKLSQLVSRIDVVATLLGPQLGNAPDPSPIPGYYDALFNLMRQHSVKRIFALTTASLANVEGDGSSLTRLFLAGAIRVIVPAAYRTVQAVGATFRSDKPHDLDWTLFRIAHIPGGDDEASWKTDREVGGVYVGPIGPQWSVTIRRGRLARWLVDSVESGAPELIGKVPAVSGTK